MPHAGIKHLCLPRRGQERVYPTQNSDAGPSFQSSHTQINFAERRERAGEKALYVATAPAVNLSVPQGGMNRFRPGFQERDRIRVTDERQVRSFITGIVGEGDEVRFLVAWLRP